MEFNHLFKKQIEAYFGDIKNIPHEISDFLLTINETYDLFENDRKLLEKAMELSSEELYESFLKVKKTNERLIEEIEKHKQTEEELIIAKEKAEEADRIKTAFVANFSHEIRTPLNAILGFSELISQEDITNEKRQLFIENIKNGGETLSKLIDDIIDISIIEAGKFKIEFTEFNLIEIFNDMEIYFNEHIKASNMQVKLVVDISENSRNLIIKSDKIRIKQVLTNLIGNALKFTEEGSVTFGYRVLFDSYVEIFVKDTGIGITNEDQKVIFNRFQKVHSDSQRLFRGTGLGLSITKNIIELLDGEISVNSEPGKGSEFIIKLRIN
jgi:signal transduction histidine kinase